MYKNYFDIDNRKYFIGDFTSKIKIFEFDLEMDFFRGKKGYLKLAQSKLYI